MIKRVARASEIEKDYSAKEAVDYTKQIVLQDDCGVISFQPLPDGRYHYTLYTWKGSFNKEARNFTNDALEWMFLNTPCVSIETGIEKTARATILITGSPRGVFRHKEDNNFVEYRCTIGSWAKAVGVPVAVDKLIQAGQHLKADKLVAAAEKAGIQWRL